MPIFEYSCRGCGQRFEAIVRGPAKPVCPGCGGRRLEKRLSVFAVGGGSASGAEADAAAPCGACGDPRGPGACALD